MILIDKNKPTQSVILTLTESTSIDDARYLMVIHQDSFPNQSFRLFLPGNSSLGIDRYDEFILDTEDFNAMDEGYYTFSVFEQTAGGIIEDESQLDEPIEVGKLYIRNTVVVPFEDQYIVYKEA